MFDFKIPSFFILFLTFIFIWIHNLRKRQNNYQSQHHDFWEQEQKSLSIRKKEIPQELYFKPNIEKLSFPELELDNLTAIKYQKLKNQILNSASLPMLSFHNLTNTEIRLKFGTANQTFITQAEENYNAFLNFLYEYAFIVKTNCPDQAIVAMEEAIRLKSDVSKHFILLGNLYSDRCDKANIQQLIQIAENLNSNSKVKILNHLQQLI